MRALSIRISGGGFLLLQAALLQVIWAPAQETIETFTIYLAYSILTGLALLAALGFFLLNQAGWLLGMMVQGICLFIALLIYFENGSLAAQLTLVYSVFMVLFLNSHLVQTAFRASPEARDTNGDRPWPR